VSPPARSCAREVVVVVVVVVAVGPRHLGLTQTCGRWWWVVVMNVST
jgi:hypothetical protein